MCGAVVLCVAITACSNLPLPRDETSGTAVPEPDTEAAAQEMAEDQLDASVIGQDQPNAPVLQGGRRENLTCFSGNDDRHARIGVELVNDEVAYFAYYSKSRPRTCSLEAGRGDPYSRWTDSGAYFTVTLADRKGKLRIEHKDGAYRFAFFDVDRRRYCGMPGKINGSLTVTRGKSSCEVQGVMDGHAL
jgi:hypothetical protein